jgi:hypothetical protein
MKKIKVKIKGTTPLLQHKMTEEQLFALLGAKTKKKKEKEDLTPRQIAEKHVYRDTEGKVVIPTSYLVGAFRHVASDYQQKNSARKSLKQIAGGIFRPVNEFERVLNSGKKPIADYEVDIRKATNHTKGAVAVCRPRFDDWQLEFEVMIDDSLVSPDTALAILNDSGKRSGIGSFRVSKGGYFGQFQVIEFKEIS